MITMKKTFEHLAIEFPQLHWNHEVGELVISAMCDDAGSLVIEHCHDCYVAHLNKSMTWSNTTCRTLQDLDSWIEHRLKEFNRLQDTQLSIFAYGLTCD